MKLRWFLVDDSHIGERWNVIIDGERLSIYNMFPLWVRRLWYRVNPEFKR